uniref:Uncharacterized protein n=1 Tax=Lepeophtheirus salmonis TaxID=72036 RepID=A0A0K2TXX0_LEPSM
MYIILRTTLTQELYIIINTTEKNIHSSSRLPIPKKWAIQKIHITFSLLLYHETFTPKRNRKNAGNDLLVSQISLSYQLQFIFYVLPDYHCHIISSPFLK